MNLNIDTWKEFKIGNLFSISPTKAYKNMSNKDLDDGGLTPFVINSACNNGIGGYSSLKAKEKGNVITFSDTTEGNTFFYQPEDFIGFAHVQKMKPINHIWTKSELLFLVTILRFTNDGLFDYGRKMRRDIISESFIKLPVKLDGSVPIIDNLKTFSEEGFIPDWDFMTNYINSLHCKPITTKNAKKEKMLLIPSEWKEFKIGRLFKVLKNGKNKSSSDLVDGNEISYIGAKREENGFMKHTKKDTDLISKGNCIVFICNGEGSVGYANYMKEDFIGTGDIVTGYNPNLNSKNGIFIATIASQERPRYSFGRKWKTTLKETIIKLPALKNEIGEFIIDSENKYSDNGFIPDWKYMEDYIESLPYSDRI